MIKYILLGFMMVIFIFFIYELGYVHGFEDSESMNHEKGERDEEKAN